MQNEWICGTMNNCNAYSTLLECTFQTQNLNQVLPGPKGQARVTNGHLTKTETLCMGASLSASLKRATMTRSPNGPGTLGFFLPSLKTVLAPISV